MLKPQRMSRVVFAGTKDQMDKTIETLFNLDILHIEDYHEEHESFSLGKTLKRGTKISEDLITVRSLSKNLDIDKDAEPVNVTKKISTHAISQQLSRDILPLQKKMLGVVERMGALERRLISRYHWSFIQGLETSRHM